MIFCLSPVQEKSNSNSNSSSASNSNSNCNNHNHNSSSNSSSSSSIKKRVTKKALFQKQHQQPSQKQSKKKQQNCSRCSNSNSNSNSNNRPSSNSNSNSSSGEKTKMCLASSRNSKKHSPAAAASLNSSLHSLSTADIETTSTSSTQSSATCSKGSSSLVEMQDMSEATEVDDYDLMDDNSNRGSSRPVPCMATVPSLKKKKRVRFASPQQRTLAYSAPGTLLGCSSTPSSSSSSPSSSPLLYPVHTEIIDKIKPASSMTDAERARVFWQLKDYEYFRGTAHIIASEVLKVTSTQPPTSHSYNAVLTRAYDVCGVISEATFAHNHDKTCATTNHSIMDGENTSDASPLPPPTTQDNHESEQDDMVLPPQLFSALTHWVKAGHSRRGLEKFCVTSHIRNRPLAKAATVQAVLLAQNLLRSQQQQQLHESQFSPKTRTTTTPTKFYIGNSEFPLQNVPPDEILRLVSQRFSKTSRVFGAALGHADAAAIGNYELK